MKKRHQITLPQAILAPVKQVMMYYLLLVRRINVKQFVIQLHQLTKLLAILVIVLMALLCLYQRMLLQTINSAK